VVIVSRIQVVVVLCIDLFVEISGSHLDWWKIQVAALISVHHGVAHVVLFAKKHEKSKLEVKYE
jgi:hypothetical protein